MTTRFIGRSFHRAAATVLVVSIAALSALPAFGAEGIPGTATLTGTVSANEPFIAAQVYAKNLDRNMLYTVFTHNGSYRAPNLLPGGYRIWAEKDGLTSRHEMLRIHGEGSIELDLAMRPGPDNPLTLKDPSKPGPQFGGGGEGAQLVSYEEMYPPGLGRDLVEPTCLNCHGHSFLPANRMGRPQWHAMISVMLDPGGAFADPNSTRSITDEEHEILADYLTENFGPDSPPRILRLDVKYPLDEAVLASAMFIEYLTPLHPGADLSQRSANEPFKHRLHRPMIRSGSATAAWAGRWSGSIRAPKSSPISPNPDRPIIPIWTLPGKAPSSFRRVQATRRRWAFSTLMFRR